ncbi:MAG: peptidylprolyl isomerase [Clostridia bacterium]|nr:peptidylprolyl isomerase [Clostridia bacterium]
MAFKRFGRIMGTVVLSGLLVGAAAAMSACATDHPEAKITVDYGGTQYVLNYKLYRNMYPQTVQHFIELADNGFYDNTIVHDYSSSSYMRLGGYAYVDNDEYNYDTAYTGGQDEMRGYLENASLEYAYSVLADPAAGKITPTVYVDYEDGKYYDPLNTLIGEFSNNQHKIENGALKSTFGCLRMYYSSKDNDAIKKSTILNNGRVRIKNGRDLGVEGEYRYNSATSLLSIQLSNPSSPSTDTSYCIFANLKNSDELTKLTTAIRNNLRTISVPVTIDNYDAILGANANSTTFSVSKTPIKIVSVSITKY